ncbi:HAMP domain-containing histidine kinase [Psychrosphaera ytuae]|uniref:histidine kinase n=1 Tax=Psychrosphaera ytuae TaxID=2820710 RepID=A0A975DAU4_9GAMM|nr:sensor histidine kinase [Psychrosphaera ytuae]QTH63528.1 HAMP domain-containing histidine kinase [Psychrosphaera ytuae]
MSRRHKSISLSTSITSAIVFVGLLTLLLSVALTSYANKHELKKESARFIVAIGDILSFNSVTPIIFEQRKGLNNFLATIENINDVSTIHIYKKSELTNNLEFFTSYDREPDKPISPQIDRLSQLKRPLFTNDYVEYALPVIEESTNQEIGYVYLRLSLQHLKENQAEWFKFYGMAAFVIALIAIALAQILKSRILSPVHRFVKDIEYATSRKRFEYQLESTSFNELQVISEAVNKLLLKIHRQLERSKEAETEITELNQNLEEKVIKRTKALRDSNQELLDALEQVHQYQSQVIQSEKMASLGQMVAGVAHEVNTPIGLGVTASTMLSDRIDTVLQQLEEQTLTATQLGKFLNESKENTQIIYRNLTRAADLISSFKQVAVDQTAGQVREINIYQYLNEIITSMQPTLKKYRHHIEIDCAPTYTIKTRPGPINQIIMNLVMNSLIHGFKSLEEGTITIKASVSGGRCYIQYRDNGAGIEEKVKQKIFDPFVTTNRGDGGSGLGMHLVYNLVTQALKGKISVHSEIGEGAQFNIDFPALLEDYS